MKKVLILALLLIGCSKNDPGVVMSEEVEVAWIYYGNDNVVNNCMDNVDTNCMEGCFWIAGDNNLILDMEGMDGIGHGYIGGNLVYCMNYGEKLHIRHNIVLDYFSIESEDSYIYAENYDILEYSYITNQPSGYDSPDKPVTQ